MAGPLWLRRLSHRRRVAGTALADCWQESPPRPGNNWRQGAYLACDAEMSSLDVGEGELLSLGWVAINEGAVDLGSAEHLLLKPSDSVGQSAAIHQLRDCEFDDAVDDKTAIEALLAAASGRILVFHYAVLDLAYLDVLCRSVYGAPLLLPVLDTLALERRCLERRDQPIASGALRLQACRERYGLPAYPAHNALVDALATAELLLAQGSHGVDLSPQ
ncbi:MAG: exonuclease domain-containing protein [Pseudomonadota bacterium]